ncbi:hypothetical protein [Agaribacterium sp. ZY112]|uniref:hypothetical protein n=1 Tax=Agaribacterium sp. ZY112 TaxID=3233574 RepID=UPI0035239C75
MAKGLIIGGVTALALAGAAVGYQSWMHQQVESKIDALMLKIEQNPEIVDVAYEDLNVSFTGDIELLNISLLTSESDDPVVFRSLRVEDYDIQHEIPHYVNVALQGLKLPDDFIAELQQDQGAFSDYLKSIGVEDTLPLDAKFSYVFDEENSQTQTTNLEIGLDKVMSYKLDWVSKDIPLEALYSDPSNEVEQATALAAMMKGSFPKLAMSISDQGGLPVFLQEVADEREQSVQELNSNWLAMANMQSQMMLPPAVQPAASDAISQVAVFLDGGKSLSISFEPQHDGSIESLSPLLMQAYMSGDYQTILDLLNLKVLAI